MNFLKLKNTNNLKIELLENVTATPGQDLDEVHARCLCVMDESKAGAQCAVPPSNTSLEEFIKSGKWLGYLERCRAKKEGVSVEEFRTKVNEHQAKEQILLDEDDMLWKPDNCTKQVSATKEDISATFLSFEDILSDEEPTCDGFDIDVQNGHIVVPQPRPVAPVAAMPPLPNDLASLDSWIAANITRVSTLYDATLQEP